MWDQLGRLLFSSDGLPHSITCVCWSPKGDLAAVGSFNLLRICDLHGVLLAEVNSSHNSP